MRRKQSSLRRVSMWALWANSSSLVALVLLLDLLAAGLTIGTIEHSHLAQGELGKCALLLVMAIGFEEIGRNTARLTHRSRGSQYTDMSSVWTIAAAILLPLGLSLSFLLLFRLYISMRQNRLGTAPFYRQFYTWASMVISLTLAHLAITRIAGAASARANGFTVALPLACLLAIVIYLCVNTLTVGAAVRLTTGRQPLSVIAGDLQENLIELATLSLGVLVGIAALHNIAFLCFAVPLTLVLQRAALVSQLEEDVATDPKTGLLNAPTWHRIGVRELARAEREHELLSVLIFDLDHFKDVNDEFGHLVGDKAIYAVANLLRAELRDYDSIARFGGEEFVALLPKTSEAEAVLVAERIREAVLTIRLADVPFPGPKLSVSVGVACHPQHGNAMDALLQAADAALYESKRLGRNRVMVRAPRPSPSSAAAPGAGPDEPDGGLGGLGLGGLSLGAFDAEPEAYSVDDAFPAEELRVTGPLPPL